MTSSPVYKKTGSASDGEKARLPEGTSQFDPAKHVAPAIAHELNNILAIVQGYTEKIFLTTNDSALQSQLKLVSEAARRAAVIIREATYRGPVLGVPKIKSH